MKFFIICNSYAQGKQWLAKKIEDDPTFCDRYPRRSDIVTATNPEHIRGMTVDHGIFLPNWESGCKDPLGFLQILHYSTGGKNPIIRQMLEERSQNPDMSFAIHKAAKALSDEIDKEVMRQQGILP